MVHILKSETAEIAFDRTTGAIVSLRNRETGWQAIRQPALAMGIRMLVPIEDYRSNWVWSECQKLSGITEYGENKCVLRWDKVIGDKSGTLDIKAELSVELQGSSIHFNLEVDNKSPYFVEEIWCPCMGGIGHPQDEPDMESLSMHMGGGFNRTPLGDGFRTECGYWGTDHPTFIRTFPAPNTQTTFILLSNGCQGVYMGMHDEDLNVVNFVHELKPGYMDNKHKRVPKSDMIGGKPAGVVISTVRMPFVKPGEKMKLAPIVICLYKGTWHKGIEPYTTWRKSWYNRRKQPAWLDEVDCWMTLHINSPEGCCRYRYDQLPEIVREAKEYGVGALQLIGWARDGQDGAEPYQDTDPRLGTREELIEAIRQIEEMGVRVLLMCKFKWVDKSIPEFEAEMAPHTLKDIYGNYVHFGGYSYRTMLQFIDGGSRRTGAGLCHLSEGYRELALREFKKIAGLGSSGILYDELANPMLLCFDMEHGHRWGESHFKGSLLLAEEFYNYAVSVNRDFLLTGEGPNDHISQYYPVNYIRSGDGSGEKIHTAAWKYMNPRMKLATCLVGWDDREMVNQCMVNGYIINYEPYNFKGRLSDIPDTVAYGLKALALRKKLWNYLWNGVFTDTVGANVVSEDKEVEYLWSVFENEGNGKKAVVVANQSDGKTLKARVALESGCNDFTVYSIENDRTAKSDGEVIIPARSLVVLVEM